MKEQNLEMLLINVKISERSINKYNGLTNLFFKVKNYGHKTYCGRCFTSTVNERNGRMYVCSCCKVNKRSITQKGRKRMYSKRMYKMLQYDVGFRYNLTNNFLYIK